MDVVLGEAEEAFIDTASTARGVGAGARLLVRARDAAKSGVPARVDATEAPPSDPDVPS